MQASDAKLGFGFSVNRYWDVLIMAKQLERREFGRRQSGSTGWIRIPGRPKLSCRIVNETPKGALLELQVPSWLPFQFELVVEADKVVHTCEIRHSRPDRLGVYYINPVDQQPCTGVPTDARRTVNDMDAWMGQAPSKK